VAPLSLGIETMGAVSTHLIEKNTTIPTSKSQVFSTAADNQPSVEVHVLQGEREFAADNRSLGKFHLDGIPSAPRGTPQIEVTFDLDANGILKVKAVDKGTGKEHSIRIEASSGLTDAEIEKMRQEAEANADADKARREVVDLKNQIDGMLHETDKQLKEHGEKLSDDDKAAIETAKTELQAAAEGADKAKMEAALANFQEKAQKLGEIIYAQQQEGAPGAQTTEGAPNPEAAPEAAAEGEEPADADFEVKT